MLELKRAFADGAKPSPKPLANHTVSGLWERSIASNMLPAITASLNEKPPLMQGFGDGADEWIRTTDLLITNQLLCQLSYIGF